MQRIDVACSLSRDNTRLIAAIELKAVYANKDNVYQIQRYIDWLKQYYIPNRVSDILPVLISKKIQDKQSPEYDEIINSFKIFNQKNLNCYPLKYIEFHKQNNNLQFEEIDY